MVPVNAIRKSQTSITNMKFSYFNILLYSSKVETVKSVGHAIPPTPLQSLSLSSSKAVQAVYFSVFKNIFILIINFTLLTEHENRYFIILAAV